MSANYEMHICNCGRIHLISYDKLDKAFEEGKEILHICAGCGTGRIFGSDTIEPGVYGNDEKMYEMYQSDFSYRKDTTITLDSPNGKKFTEILYSQGIKVPMRTGNYANSYFNGFFYDNTAPYWQPIESKDVTKEEIVKFIDKYKFDSRKVHMQRFIDETPHDILDEISNWYIKGLDWKGTKYEKY